MRYREWLPACVVLMVLGMSPADSRAQVPNALQECIALSPEIDDIHSCMDNYLDLLDGSLQNITEFIAESLEGDARVGLNSSQQAFIEYRQQNCLWYLEFSFPRSEAEQIAKNCLARMSQQRLQELQGLLRTDEGERQIVSGFYVYGSDRNSFQPCGSPSRYWLEGDSSQLGKAQQQYLNTATSDLQLLFVSLTGEIDEDALAPAGHQGVFNLTSVVDLRVPTEGDCQLPTSTRHSADGDVPALATAVLPTAAAVDEVTVAVEVDGVEEQLIGYFGDWLADCTDIGGDRACRLSVDFTSDRGVSPGVPPARLSLIRRSERKTGIEVFFSEREIDSPLRIRWTVDEIGLGDIVQSEIRVDQRGTRQLVQSSDFVSEELIPMMMRGKAVMLEVLDNVDDIDGDRLLGSLIGVTDALTFADDFISGGAL